MTFIEAIARYLCSQPCTATYTDGRNATCTLQPLRLSETCFVHEGPGSDKLNDFIVIGIGDTVTLPPDDPRHIQSFKFVVNAPDYFALGARVAWLRGVFARMKVIVAPSATNPLFHARVEDNPEPSPEGKDDLNRCVSIVQITIQYVNL